MFNKRDILYEDNHLLAVNKHAGDLVQSDTEGTLGLEDYIKEFIKIRDEKPGEVFLGVVHRIDRPVSGVVLFAKTSKALVRLNEMVRSRNIDKRYWAITEEAPEELEGTLVHYISRDGKTNKASAYNSQKGDAKRAELRYKLLGGSKNYKLLEVELITGRHHQIRCQLSKVGCPIKGDFFGQHTSAHCQGRTQWSYIYNRDSLGHRGKKAGTSPYHRWHKYHRDYAEKCR